MTKTLLLFIFIGLAFIFVSLSVYFQGKKNILALIFAGLYLIMLFGTGLLLV